MQGGARDNLYNNLIHTLQQSDSYFRPSIEGMYLPPSCSIPISMEQRIYVSTYLTFNLFESYKDYAHYTSCPSCPSYVHWSQSKKARVEMGRRRELTLYSKNKYKYKFI